jgi:predicted nucleotide-binding protein
MARRPNQSPPGPPAGPPSLKFSRVDAAERLTKRISLGGELQGVVRPGVSRQIDVEEYRTNIGKWDEYNKTLLRALFTNETIAEDYTWVGYTGIGVDESRRFPRDIEITDARIVKLESILEQLDLFPEPVGLARATDSTAFQAVPSKIFVVHGHDLGARDAVARFLTKIELETIILQEEPDQGLTIIEKFEKYASQVGFAVVILTPDDVGGSVSAATQAVRARQNVIFELGYFAGKLGRGKACLLRKGEIEIPSDLYGVIYTNLDADDGWKLKLAKELKAAGLKFDGDKVF